MLDWQRYISIIKGLRMSGLRPWADQFPKVKIPEAGAVNRVLPHNRIKEV